MRAGYALQVRSTKTALVSLRSYILELDRIY